MPFDAIETPMFADKDDTPKGNPSEVPAGSPEAAQPVQNQLGQQPEGPTKIIRSKRRRRHRRTRRKHEIKAKLVWEIILGGVLLVVLVLLLFALSQSTGHINQPPPAQIPPQLGS